MRKYSELEKTILEIIENTPKAVTVDYVARQMRVSWSIALSHLYELALEGKIEAIKTTHGYVFRKAEGLEKEARKT